MNEITFNYHETLLGLKSVVSNADGKNHSSEVEARVNMILNEGISTTTIDAFKSKYDQFNSLELTYNACLEALQGLETDEKAKALAYMWLVANVGTKKDDVIVDLSHLEEVESWQNSKNYVDVEELNWINRAKKDLKVSLDEMKTAFANLPEARRITG